MAKTTKAPTTLSVPIGTANSFYNLTKDTFEHLAMAHGYTASGTHSISSLFALPKITTINDVFEQFALHAQNRQRLSNVVKFRVNYRALSGVLMGFDPGRFYSKYGMNVPAVATDLAIALKLSKPGKMINDYAQSLCYGAKYLRAFSSKSDVVADIIGPSRTAATAKYGSPYTLQQFTECLIDTFRKNIRHGFGIALTCDFLKELDAAFNFLAKPDVHIIDTLSHFISFKGKDLDAVFAMQDLTNDINASLLPTAHITVYQLDKMIWLICSGSFPPLSSSSKFPAPLSMKGSYISRI